MARLGWLRRLGLGLARPAARRDNAPATPTPRLVVETLEDRLPPGDAVGGMLAISDVGADPLVVEPQPAHIDPLEIVEGDEPEEVPVSDDSEAVVTVSFVDEADGTLTLPATENDDPLSVLQMASASGMSVYPEAPAPAARAADGPSGSAPTGNPSGSPSTPAAPTSGNSGGRVTTPPPSSNDPKAGLLGSQHLNQLHQKFTNPDSDAVINPHLQIDIKDRVLVQVRSTGRDFLERFTTRLQDLGMEVANITPSAHMVTGWLPIANIPSLRSVPNFSAASPVYRPVLRTGSVNTQGDAAMGTNLFRAQNAVNGAGIKIGVLSDSVNQFGGGLAASQATGDLPAVEVLTEGAAGSTDEGRAMLELIHDIAPGSALAFYSATNGAADFANGIRALFNAGARVITDDIGYLNSPMFSVGRMGQAIAEITAGGAIYTTAAGNDGDNGWREAWNPITATVDNITGNFQSFNGSALQTFTLQNNESIDIGFRWSEAYLEGGDGAANFQVDADYAVYVVNADTGAIVATQDDDNANLDEAFELVSFTNDGSFNTTNFALAFRLKSGPAPDRLGWVQHGGPEINALDGGDAAQYGQVLAPGAITVGAAPFTNVLTPEPFTSVGGSLELFSDELGNPLATPQVVFKPDVTGPDGTSTTFFGQPSGFGFQFFGTSAAAPHVAGAAALILHQSPAATNVDVANHLRSTALDIGAPGPDAVAGHGFVRTLPLTVALTAVPDTGPILPPDVYEDNDTSDRAQDLGVLLPGTLSYGNLTIAPEVERLADFDWYRITMAGPGLFSLSAQGFGTGLTLEAHLFVLSGGVLTEVSSENLSPTDTASLSLLVGQATTLYIEVKGASNGPGGFQRGGYTMNLGLS